MTNARDGAADGDSYSEGSGRVLFVVEDDPALRSLLVSHLGRGGHRVLSAGDAASAIRHLVEAPMVDLVITDVHLPNLSGVDLLRLLQAHSPMKPVLVITGDDDDAMAREVLASGAAGYLLKPFKLSELDGAVGQALGRLELLERLGDLIPPAPPTHEFLVPLEWLDLADRRSSAGAGHGRRVERISGVLANRAGLRDETPWISLAARLHELARLTAPEATEEDLPAEATHLLERVNAPPEARALVRGMVEWWRPEAGARGGRPGPGPLLIAADRIDHEAVRRVDAGVFPPTAILEAIQDVGHRCGELFGPEVARAVHDAQEVLSAIWILGRGGYPAHPPPVRRQ